MKLFCLHLISLLFFYLLSLPELSAQDHIITNYNINEGLVQSTVRAICQDSTGYIWFGTDHGLSRFDGDNFKNYTEPAELFNNPIRDIAQLNHETLLLITLRRELWKFDGINFTPYRPVELEDDIIFDIHVAGRDSLLLGTRKNGVFFITPEDTLNFTIENGLYSNNIIEISSDAMSNIFIITSEGVNTFSNNMIQPLFENREFKILGIIQLSDGSYWCAAENGYYTFEDDKWQRVTGIYGLRYSLLAEESPQDFWAINNHGLFRFVKNSLGEIYNWHIIPAYFAFNLLIDDQNNIWCGTQGRGVYKVSRNPFENQIAYQSFPGLYGRILLKDSDDNVWLSAVDHGIIKANNYGSSEYRAGQHVRETSAIELGKNKILFASYNGLKLLKDEKFSSFNETGLNEKRIYSLAIDKSAIIYAGTQRGVFKYEKDKWEKLEINEQVDNSRVNFIFVDSKNQVWLGTRNFGLFNLSGSKYFLSDKPGSDNVVSIEEDHIGNIWLATLNGIFVLNNGEIVNTIGINDGIHSPLVYALARDKDKMYIGTSDGLGIYNDGKIELFSTTDGMITNDINSSKIAVTSSGKVWFGHTSGMSIFLSNIYFKKTRNFNFVLENVITDQDSLQINPFNKKLETNNIVFQPGLDFINFKFRQISFTSKSFKYKYRITRNGNTGSWIVIPEPNIFIEDCSPGQYKMEIAVKAFGNEWENKKELLFNIQTSFYQTAEFIISISLLSILLAVLVRYRILNERKKKKYKTSSLNQENKNLIKSRLIELVDINKQYKDSSLTLQKLSVELNLPKEHISQVVNSEFKLNFNDFINSYRINEAKRLLDKNGGTNLSILQIAYEVGFNSKSSFNNAFKKFTSMTPTEYKKNNST